MAGVITNEFTCYEIKRERIKHRHKMNKPGDPCLPHFAQVFSYINSFRSAYKAACFIGIPFSLISITGNIMMLVCLWKCRTIHRPFKALLRNLVLSDLGVGLIVQPLFLASKYTALTQNVRSFCDVHEVYSTVGYCLAGVSFLTSTAIAVDRVIAIQLRLRYRHSATLRRIHSLLAFIWVLCISISCVWIWNVSLYKIIRNVLLCSCIIVASLSYIRVFMLVRRHQVGLAVNQPQPNAANARPLFYLGRYKRSVSSAVYVFCFLLMCYLPYLCLSITARRSDRGSTLFLCVDIATVLVFANSSFNPVLYCWRIPEIRQNAKETFGKILCKRS